MRSAVKLAINSSFVYDSGTQAPIWLF